MWSPARACPLLVTCLALTVPWAVLPHVALARSAATTTVLGRAPTNCPATPAPERFTPEFGPGWGGGSVWAVGLGAGQSFLIPGQAHSSGVPGRSVYGWGNKILWAVAVSSPGRVTLRGWNLRTGQPIHFGFGGTEPAAPTPFVTVAHLDAQAARAITHNSGAYEGFPSEEYFPSAGCYVLYAQWRTGSWIVPVAFGR